MKVRSVLVAAAAAFLLATPAQAIVVYTFTATTSNPGTFQLTTADFIAADITFTPAELDSCSSFVPGFTCGDQEFDVAPSFFGNADKIAFQTTGSGTATTQFTFAAGSFGAYGIYNSTGASNIGILEVSRTAPGAVPEPASWALLITGFGIVGGALRRRRRAPLVSA